MHTRKHLVTSTLILLTIAATVAVAQNRHVPHYWRVVDAKQASIAGASVTITNEATRVTQTQTTTEQASTLSIRCGWKLHNHRRTEWLQEFQSTATRLE